MLMQRLPHRRLRGLAAAAVLGGLLLVPTTAAAMDAGTAEVDAGLANDVATTATVDELRTLIEDLSVANEALNASNADLQATVDAISQERDRLAVSLERFDQLYDPIESDRQLLFELRKEMPETRPEAEARLDRIRSLALASDAQRLGQLVDRVDESAQVFLDWRFGEHESSADFTAAYVQSGANAFDASFNELEAEALMTVANRLDSLLTILDRVR